MKDLTKIIQIATGKIGQGYFHLKIDGGDPIYRERVYCYELYHQMRMLWPPDSRFHLNGELDKAAHPILRDLGADYAKPDFLVHQPGNMRGNHAIIEVKSSEAVARSIDGIRKDLKTLSLFIRKVKYQRAIYLIFGHEEGDLAERVRNIAAEFHELGPIELWLHRSAGEPASHISVLGSTS